MTTTPPIAYSGATHAPSPPLTLDLDSVRFNHGPREVLASVSLTVGAGQVVGLIGPNGAGKTTVLRLAAGLAHPASGQVRLTGRRLADLDRASIARRVALVPQDALLPPAFTVWEFVLLGRIPHLSWLAGERAHDLAVAYQALALVGASTLTERRLGDLSGGERQRVALARALAQEPDLLLLDEPTLHLDLAHQLLLLDLVHRLTRAAGLAALCVLHDLNLASAYCDTLVCLHQGRVAAAGPPTVTLTEPLLREVYSAPLLVTSHPISGRPVVLLPGAPTELNGIA